MYLQRRRWMELFCIGKEKEFSQKMFGRNQ